MSRSRIFNKTITTTLILLLTASILSVTNINIIKMPPVYGINIPIGSTTYFYVNTTHWSDTSIHPSVTPLLHALGNATTDTTVNVMPGQYNGTYTINTAGLYLVSNQSASNTVIDAYDLIIAASDVTISGFTFISTMSDHHVVVIDSSSSILDNITITNSVFNLTKTTSTIGISIGEQTTNNKVSNVTISYNSFNGPADKIANPWKIGGWFGNPIGCEVETVKFEHNTVYNCSIPINLHDKNMTTILISSNTFRNTDGVVYVWETADSPTGKLSYFVFTNNDVDSTNTYGVGIDTHNKFTDANFGDGNRINYNNFVGIPGAYGFNATSILSSLTTYKLNAILNWWGNATGPHHSTNPSGTGCAVSDFVDYTPWLEKPYQPAVVSNTPWPMFHHDLNHTGCSASPAPKTNQTLWFFLTGYKIFSSPAVADGLVFFGSEDHYVYAVEEATGEYVWNYVTGAGVVSSPAVSDGLVFISSQDDRVYALNETTGELVWRSSILYAGWSSPAVSNGLVFFGSEDNNVYALNEMTGAVVWNYPTDGSVVSSPAVSQGLVFVGSQDGSVYALNETTGQLVWEYETTGPVSSSPAVADGLVFVGSEDGLLYALNETNGGHVWNYTTGGSIKWSSPAVADGLVFVGSEDNNIYALKERTGELLWKYATGDYVWSSPAVADGLVFVGSKDGNIYALDEITGAIVWSYKTEGPVNSSPTVADGLVFTATEGWINGKLYAFGSIYRDVAITNATVSTIEGYAGDIINVTVVAKNKGLLAETFNVTAYYNENVIGTQTVTDLAPIAEIILTFSWNTSGSPSGNYTISAEAIAVSGETETADNFFTDGYVTLRKYRENYLSVPFYYQSNLYYCGPASLEMVFDYYGEDISQLEIADVARTNSSYGTYTDDMRRATHFSNLSTSVGDEMPGNITGYTARKLGYGAFERHDLTISQLKDLIDDNNPIIALMWYDGTHVSGHYRVMVGYNETHVVLHDPWNNTAWGGTYGGPNVNMTYSEFLDLWEHDGYWALFVHPWNVTLTIPTEAQLTQTFNVTATVTYTCPASFPTGDYPATQCNAIIALPAELGLASGETVKKTLNTGNISAGSSTTVTWTVNATSLGTYTISVEAEGKIAGSVSTAGNYPGYSYEDRIGGSISGTVQVLTHDVAIKSVTPSATVVYEGQIVNIAVVVKNEGNYTETFNVTAHYDETVIGTQTVIDLAPTAETTLTFSWNTMDVTPDIDYTIKAEASVVMGETDVADNVFDDGIVSVKMLTVKIAEVISCNLTGHPVNSSVIGTQAYFKVIVNNTASESVDVLVTINIYDADAATLGVTSIQGPIAPGTSTFILSLPIPNSAHVGAAMIYACAFTDWPHLGGVSYCPERSATFEILGQ